MKKNVVLSTLVALCIFFTGCIESTEEITINSNGSGSYNMNMDLSGMFDFINMMKGMDTTTANTASKQLSKSFDTTMYLRDFSDTSTKLNATQKRLLKDAKMKMVMNEEAHAFSVDINFPFTQLADIEKIMQLSGKGNGGNAVNKMFGGGESAGSNEKMPEINSSFNMVVKEGLLVRTINKEKYKLSLSDETLGSFAKDKKLAESIKLNTVIHLPKAVKKLTGTKATLSADKKTVTIKATLATYYNEPQTLDYRIEY